MITTMKRMNKTIKEVQKLKELDHQEENSHHQEKDDPK
jgi:hypothetical protein